MPQYIPVDPQSQVAKDLAAVEAVKAPKGTLVPVDPADPAYKAIMTGQDLADRQEAARPGAQPNAARVRQVQGELSGDTQPRPMGGAAGIDIDFKTGKAKLKPSQAPEHQGSYGPAAVLLSGGLGRIAQAVIGGGSAAIEGGSPTDIAIGAAAPGAGEVAGKLGKAALRGASKFMSPAAVRTAGSAIQEEAKTITKPVLEPVATRAALEEVGTSVRTPEATINALREHVTKLSERYGAGKPFSYGDFFEHANQIGQKAAAAFESKAGQATGAQLRRVQAAMMDDLAQIRPEAKVAAEAWKNAVNGLGGWSGAKKVWAALGSVGIPGAGAVLAPVTGAAGGAGAVVTALAGLMVRTPGVGQTLARSLITPDGTVVKEALPALAKLIATKGQNGND